MATQLGIYNMALTHLGLSNILTIGEDRESRRVFDAIWSSVKAHCLEQGMWVFALRSATIASTTLPAINYGHTYAHTKPSDCVYTYLVSANSSLYPQLTAEAMVEAEGLYFANATPLYVRYSSNDAAFGGAESRWSESFAQYVAAFLASQSCYRLTKSPDLKVALAGISDQLRQMAVNTSSVNATIGAPAYNALARREFFPGGNPPENKPFGK